MGFGETSTVSANGGKIKQRSSKKRSFLVEFNFVRLLDAYIYQSSFFIIQTIIGANSVFVFSSIVYFDDETLNQRKRKKVELPLIFSVQVLTTGDALNGSTVEQFP